MLNRMPLRELSLPGNGAAPPREVRAFLREAERRIARFRRTHLLPGFVPCDFVRAHEAVRALAAENVAPGNLFCEWGSGFGVVACLAALAEFDACGIEIEPQLVDAARQLADDFDLPAQFYCGSFLPGGGTAARDGGQE